MYVLFVNPCLLLDIINWLEMCQISFVSLKISGLSLMVLLPHHIITASKLRFLENGVRSILYIRKNHVQHWSFHDVWGLFGLVHVFKNWKLIVWKYLLKYMWLKKWGKICVMLFKNWKLLFENTNQTSLHIVEQPISSYGGKVQY